MTSQIIEVGNPAIIHCKDIAALPPESLSNIFSMVLQSVGPMRHAVNVPFHDSQARAKAILIRTDWDQTRTEPGPYLHDELVFRLIRARVRLVGLDFGNADYSQLIANGIPVIEYMSNLVSLPKWGGRLSIEPSSPSGDSCKARVFGEVIAQGAS